MTPGPGSRFLHVANGTSTTRLIEAAGIPGARSIWADVLYEGPVPGGVNDEELLAVRRRFHEDSSDLAYVALQQEHDPSLDPANDMRAWRTTIASHTTYDELILWFEHDLFDQLNLIQLLPWIRHHLPSGKRVSLVCIGSFPGRPHFKGLGELAPRELASLLLTRQAVSAAQYELAERAWRAFRESTPESLNALRQSETSALPYLAAAITRFLQEYPWTGDGLSRTERRLLELAHDGGITLRKAFPRMHEGERAYYVADGSLAGLAESLSRTTPALLTLDVGSATGEQGLRGSISLTEAGRRVVAGTLDRIAACGIDRWLGGVHLEGRDRIWRWDEAGKSIARS